MASQLDFRRLDEGLGGQRSKRKRAAEETQEEGGGDGGDMEIEDVTPSAKRPAIAGDGDDRPVFGRPTYDGTIAGKVSGRKWKNPKSARTSSIKVSLKKPSLEQRNQQREIKKAYKERMGELKEQIRQNKISKRKAKEEREKRKKENEARTGTVYQKITNSKKLKNMSKKQKKLLRVLPE
ncbi:hypothetical protein GOP47_0004602 [Adiantum capillus-veneris]|uniref:Coiled-coil domain-containing protein 86 n=1 Tax=Adiantum capillus-veneris TaxID=13818 RepID=A0A9D4V7V4_ADICA|nr:hypothetical protein GOP47_0004602 [Adiantum capillus-veneris]